MLVLLTWWLDLPEHHDYQTLEFFAGVGRIAAMSQFCGYQSAAVDIEYGKPGGNARGSRHPMDLNSNAGLMLLA